MNKLSKWVIQLSPIQMGLLLLLVPFLSLFLTGFVLLLSLLLGFEFETPLYEFAFFFMHFIFLLWIWTLSVVINERTLKINNRFFKIAFFFYFFNRVVFFLYYLYPEYFVLKIHFSEGVLIALEALVLLYIFIVYVTFIYLSVFKGDIISKITVNKPKNTINQILTFLFVMTFPIGIPLLQRQIQVFLMENKLFGFEYPKSSYTNTPQPLQEVEEKVEENTEEIDKEDPRRFMPK